MGEYANGRAACFKSLRLGVQVTSRLRRTMIRIAKITYWASGQLSRIKTTQQLWKLDEITDDGIISSPAGRRKLPCRLSVKVLGWSMRLDREHWDHWALKHDDHDGSRCDRCGGIICENTEELPSFPLSSIGRAPASGAGGLRFEPLSGSLAGRNRKPRSLRANLLREPRSEIASRIRFEPPASCLFSSPGRASPSYGEGIPFESGKRLRVLVAQRQRHSVEGADSARSNRAEDTMPP